LLPPQKPYVPKQSFSLENHKLTISRSEAMKKLADYDNIASE
jgi:hypothetical protein